MSEVYARQETLPWSAVHAPGANVQATASKAAGGAGVRHVCTSITATLGSTGTVVASSVVNLRDGATGVGTILWSGRMTITAVAGDSSAPICLSGLEIVGSPDTAMTLEFAGAAGAGVFETVTLTGWTKT